MQTSPFASISKRLLSPCVTLLSLFFGISASAAVYTYTPVSGASDNWSAGTDWTPGATAPVSGSTTELTFTGANATVLTGTMTDTNTDDISGAFSLNIMDLQGTGPNTGAGTITISGSNGTSLNFTNNGATGPVVNLAALTGSAGLTYNVNNSITLSNNITFQGNGTANFNFNGVIGGAGNLTKAGTSTLTLAGANTYTGSTAITSGTLLLDGNAPSGSAGTLGNASSTVMLGNTTTTSVSAALWTDGAGTVGRNITLQTGTGQDLIGAEITSGSAYYTGSITLGTGTFGHGVNFSPQGTGGAVVVSGVIQDPAGLTGAAGLVIVQGNGSNGGTVVFSGANTYSGGTQVGNAANNVVLTVVNSGAVSGGTNNGLGTGPVTLTLNPIGGLNLKDDGAGGAGSTNVENINYGNNVTVNNGTYLAVSNIGDLTANKNVVLGTLNMNTGSTGNVFTLNSANGYTIQFGAVTMTSAGGLTTNANTTFGALGGAGALLKAGAGTLFLSAAGSYTGAFTDNAGIVNFVNGGLGTTPSSIKFTGGTLQYAGGNSQDVSSYIAGSTSAVAIDTGTNSVTFATGLPSTNTAGLSKAGLGTLTLSASDSYTGSTTISNGTLSLTAAGAVSSGTIGVSGAAGNTTTLNESVPNAINGASGLSVTTGGFNTANLSQPNNFTGTVSVAGANGFSTLALSNTNALQSAGLISLSNGGVLALLSNAAATFNTPNGLNIGNTDTIFVGNNGSGTGQTLSVTGTMTFGNNFALTVTSTNGYTLSVPNVAASASSNGFTVAPTTGNLTIGSISNAAGNTGAVHLNGYTTGNSITGTSNLGTMGVTTAGVGIWTLSGSNLYTGATTISTGALDLANSYALGVSGSSSSGVTVASGGGLQMSGGITTATAVPLSLNGTGYAAAPNGALENVSGTNTYTGLVTLAAASTIGSDAGQLVLSNAGTITGATFGLTLAGAGNGSIASSIGTTTGGLTKIGTGTWTLSATNSYSGGTTINAGTLQINDNATTPNILLSTGTLTLGGGTLSITGTSASAGAVTQNVGTLALTANTSSAITLTEGGSATAASLTSTNTTLAPANGTSLYLNLVNSGTGALTLGTVAGVGFTPWAVVADTSGSTGFGSINSTSHQLVRDLSTTALTATSSGTSDYTSNPATDSGGSQYSSSMLTMTGSNHTIDSLFITTGAAGTLDLDGFVLGLTSNALGMTGSNNYTIQDGQLGLSGSFLTISQEGTGTLTVNSTVSGSGGGLFKDGSGLVVLGTANAYTGLTTVSAGTLQLGASGSINSGNALTTNGAGAFDLNGATQTLGTVTNNGFITSSSGTGSLIMGNASTGAGNFTGSLNVTLNNVGTSGTLSGNWTNTGNLTLNANGAGTITLSGVVNNAGTITNSGTGSGGTTISTAIGSNVTTVTQNSATSALNLSGVDTFTGGLDVLSGTVNVSQAYSLGGTGGGTGAIVLGDGASDGHSAALLATVSIFPMTNPITLAANTTGALIIGQGAGTNTTTVFSGPITGTNNLTIVQNVAGTGSGFYLYYPTLNITGGITSIGTGSEGTTIDSIIGGNVTYITEASTGGGTLALVGNNTSFTGSTTLQSGILNVDAVNALGYTSSITINGGILDAGVASIALPSNPTETWNGNWDFEGNALSTGTGTVTLGNNVTVGFLGNNSLTVGGNITGGYALTKTAVEPNTEGAAIATGALILSGSNNYTGGTNILYGTLEFASSVPSTGTIFVASPAPMAVNAVPASIVAFGAAPSQSVLSNVSGSSAGVFALAGVQGVSNNLNFSGLGNVSFGATSAAAIYSGTLTPFNQTYQLGGGGSTLTIASPLADVNGTRTNLVVDPAVAGSSPGNVTLDVQNTYSGVTQVNTGTLTLDFTQLVSPASQSNIINPASTLALNNDATLSVLGRGITSSTTSQTFNGVNLLSGNETISETAGGNSAAALITNLGAINRGNEATLLFSATPNTTTTEVTTTNTNVNGLLGTWADSGATTTLSYDTVNGNGQIVAYTGGTAGTAGSLANVTSNTTNYTFAANATQTGAVTANTLQYTGATGTLANGGFTTTLNGLMNAGTGLLTVSGAGSLQIGTQKELDILSNAQGVTISSTIIDGTAGASSLVYGGSSPGTLTLSGTNTYSGGTTLNTGTIVVGNNSALGTGLITLAGGSLLNTAASTITLANNLFSPAGTTAILGATASTGNLTISGTLTGGGTLVTTGPNGGGAATLTLGGNNSGFTGTIVLNQDTFSSNHDDNLNFGATAGGQNLSQATLFGQNGDELTLGLAPGAGVTQIGAVAGTLGLNGGGSGSVVQFGALGTNTAVTLLVGNGNTQGYTKVGAGTTTINNSGNYRGEPSAGGAPVANFVVNGGTLAIDFSNYPGATNIFGGVSGTPTLALNGGTYQILAQNGVPTTQSMGSLTLGAGYSSVIASQNGSTAGVLVPLSGITRVAGASLNFTNPSGTLSSINGITTTTGNNNGILGGWATVGGSAFAVSGGSATAPITALAVYTGTNSTGVTGTGGNYVQNAAVTLSSNLTVNTLTINDSGSNSLMTSGDNVTFTYASATNVGGLLYAGNGSGGGAYSITGGGIIGSGTAGEFIVNVNSGANLTIANSIVSQTGGAGFLTKAGAGTLTLSATGAFTGTNYLNAGIVNIAADNDLGTGTIKFNGGTLQLASSYASTLFSNNRTLDMGYDGGTINTNGNSSVTYGGVISSSNGVMNTTSENTAGQFTFTKAGAGTLILSNTAQTYMGATIITGGVLSVSNLAPEGTEGDLASGIGMSSNYAKNLLLNGGTLQYTGTTASTDRLFTLGDSGGALDASGSGPISFTNTGSVGYQINSLGASNNTSPTLTLTGTNTGANTLAATLGNNGIGTTSLTKAGTGTWALTAANTFTGAVSIQNGTLSVGTVGTGLTAQALGEGNTVNLGVASTSSGDLTYTGATGTLDKNINALGNGSDTVQNAGTGLLTLTGTLTKNGTTLDLGGGSSGLTVTGPIVGALANSDLVAVSGTVTLTSTSNTYNGPTDITGGATLVNGASTGALPTSTTLNIGGANNSTGTFNLDGNSQTVAGLNSVGSGGAANLVTNIGGSGTATLTVSTSGTFGGTISDGTHATALSLSGGALALTGTSTYSGATNIAGTLVVSGSLSGSGAVNVNAGGDLGGSGGVNGATTVAAAGTINPGVGLTTGTTLTINQVVTFNNGSTFAVNIDSNNNVTDTLAIGGALTLNGTDSLTFALVNGSSLANLAPGNYLIATYTGGTTLGTNGQFTTDPTLQSNWSISYATPDDVYLDVAAVPEPGTWGMLVGGAGMLLVGQRLRRRGKS